MIAGLGDDGVERGLAFGQGAGFVDERVSTLPKVSRASALRMRMPARAPRPVPTMMAMGVASPSAQGQATIRTATALTRAWAKRG